MEADDVVMYCRSWCGDCARARAWLDMNRVAYKEIDIERVPGAADECRALAGKIVTPTFRIKGETVVDFDESRLRELLLG